MTQWEPDQQIIALKYNAYFSLLASGMFITILAKNILIDLNLRGDNTMSALSMLCAFGFIYFAVRWAKKCKGNGFWQAFFARYNEELACELSRKANSNSFFSLALMLLPATILGDPPVMEHLGSNAEIWLSLSNYAMLMLIVASVVWGSTILFNLSEEAEF